MPSSWRSAPHSSWRSKYLPVFSDYRPGLLVMLLCLKPNQWHHLSIPWVSSARDELLAAVVTPHQLLPRQLFPSLPPLLGPPSLFTINKTKNNLEALCSGFSPGGEFAVDTYGCRRSSQPTPKSSNVLAGVWGHSKQSCSSHGRRGRGVQQDQVGSQVVPTSACQTFKPRRCYKYPAVSKILCWMYYGQFYHSALGTEKKLYFFSHSEV